MILKIQYSALREKVFLKSLMTLKRSVQLYTEICLVHKDILWKEVIMIYICDDKQTFTFWT